MSTDKFVFGVGPAEKIQEAFRRNIKDVRGHEMEILEWLAEGDNIVKVGQVAHGISIVGTMEYSVDLDAPPVVPDGWKVESYQKGGQFKWDPTKVELYLDADQQNGKTIEGKKLRKKLESKDSFNANLLDFLLAHPELIPESWKDKCVFFWGTVCRRADGYLCVRYLGWDGDGWYWDFRWLGGVWRGDDPAAVPSK